MTDKTSSLVLKGVKVHNLKNVDLSLPAHKLIVFSGVSGSGKSSMAFDTLYMEGQRRYIESLSASARQAVGEFPKPDLEHAEGLTPTVSIEQKTVAKTPRSTIGTITQIYDFLRVAYARLATFYCPISGDALSPRSKEEIIEEILSLPEETKVYLYAPYAREKKAEFKEDFRDLLRRGFTRVRIDGKQEDLTDERSLDPSFAHNVDVLIDRFIIRKSEKKRIADSATGALEIGKGMLLLLFQDTQEELLFSMHAYSPKSGIYYPKLEPQDFSFNSPSGMCPHCQGLGETVEYDLRKVIDQELSIAEDCCKVASSYQTVRFSNIYENLARLYDFSVDTPWKKLPEKARHAFLYGIEKKWTKMRFVHPVTGAVWHDHIQWRGVLYEAKKRYEQATSASYKKHAEELMSKQLCRVCNGSRLLPYPSSARLGGKTIKETTALSVEEAYEFFINLKVPQEKQVIAKELVKEVAQRLRFLLDVGVGYLTLDRSAPTISGGEAQRVRLASQIGSGLVGITYVLDEPSIGLHPSDNEKLIHTLHTLRDKGNTVVVVEHDEETLLAADYVVDFGPGPGVLGGKIVYQGPLEQFFSCQNSLTADYLSGKKQIIIPKKRRKVKKTHCLHIEGASHHNLKNINVNIPLGIFTCVTGVSGSGKSSLISDILYPHLANTLAKSSLPVGEVKSIKGVEKIDKAIEIDQSPIGKTPRSNPATYIKVFDEIRDLFSQLPEARARGWKPGRFSFNVKIGTCPHCFGLGMVKVDMDFMEDVWIECPSCHGRRFDEETLSVLYKGHTIYDILEMEIEKALELFQAIPSIRNKLQTLVEVGLGYLKLGQSSTTLSGGEAQRIKLAKELCRPSTTSTLYLFDEPSTGLHFHDIQKLLGVMQKLVDKGCSLIVIEHNTDVIKCADWVIDLGPEGGDGGGLIVAEGTPENIAASSSKTAPALWQALYGDKQEFVKTFKRPLADKQQEVTSISVQKAQQHNLKNVDISLARNQISVFTGPSGSGKTSLAFDTIFAEGQRRYTDSLSPYARQFIQQMGKPIVEKIEGLSPAISIEQKVHAGNPRSTIGTMTEIYDFLRLLYSRIGVAHCPETGEEIRAISKEYVVDKTLALPDEEKIQILAPIAVKRGQPFIPLLEALQQKGYVRFRLNDTYYSFDDDLSSIPYDPKRKNTLFLVVDRLKVSAQIRNRLLEAIEHSASLGNNKVIIALENKDLFYNLSFSSVKSGISYPEITPQTFAFNTREGMCLECQGLGVVFGANIYQREDLLNLSFALLLRALLPGVFSPKVLKVFQSIMDEEGVDMHTPIRELPLKNSQFLLQGSDKTFALFKNLEVSWPGLNAIFAKTAKHGISPIRESAAAFCEEIVCASCKGARLNPLARNVKIDGKGIAELCALPVSKAAEFLKKLKIKQEERDLLQEVLSQLEKRLQFLEEVGLNYLSLDRKAPTLSGGETQRIRLARQLGATLSGVLYVLDEPTIGLHPRDIDKLLPVLKNLQKIGNTLLLVEHEPEVMKAADRLYDFGPGSGVQGGEIVAEGTYKQLLKNPRSLTGKYLSKELVVASPSKKRSIERGFIELKKLTKHNLKNIDLQIPKGLITCITGVSGSGKSTVLEDGLGVLLKEGLQKQFAEKPWGLIEGTADLDKVFVVDQNPVGQTVRSTVATYSELADAMRSFFFSLPEAKMRGLQGKHFSSNHRAGMCTTCWGLGFKRVEMHFLPSIRIPCPMCQGLRLNPVSLEVRYKGKNFGEHLQQTVDQAVETFEHFPKLKRICETLQDVGLGYLQLGQEVATLSGGEAQRLKLAKELSKRSSKGSIYLLDEPTTGLHFCDIEKLVNVLNRLADKGCTIVVVEHNLDFIRTCDWVIDLGPESGEEGGEVLYQGVLEGLAFCTRSHTGRYLFKED